MRDDCLHATYSTINSFRELSPDDARQHMRIIHRHTVPRGRYILGLHLIPIPTSTPWNPVPERFKGERHGVKVKTFLSTRSLDIENRQEIIDLRLNVNDRGTKRRIDQQLTYTTWTLGEIRELFRVTGWRVVGHHGFDFKKIQRLSGKTEDVIFTLERT